MMYQDEWGLLGLRSWSCVSLEPDWKGWLWWKCKAGRVVRGLCDLRMRLVGSAKVGKRGIHRNLQGVEGGDFEEDEKGCKWRR